MRTALDDKPPDIRLLNGLGGEVEITPDEMHSLNALTEGELYQTCVRGSRII